MIYKCCIFWNIRSFSLEKQDSSGGRYLCPTFPDSPSAKRNALSHLSPQRAGRKEEEKKATYVKNESHTLINIGSVCKHYFQAHWKCNPLKRGKNHCIIKRWYIIMHDCKRGIKIIKFSKKDGKCFQTWFTCNTLYNDDRIYMLTRL